MMRFGRIEDMDRSFDIEFWQRQGDAAIFRAAWELVEAYWRDRSGVDPIQARIDGICEYPNATVASSHLAAKPCLP
jgi:hypothetical protein